MYLNEIKIFFFYDWLDILQTFFHFFWNYKLIYSASKQITKVLLKNFDFIYLIFFELIISCYRIFLNSSK